MLQWSAHSTVKVRDLREPEWLADARYYDYMSAADPIRRGSVSAIPIARFPSKLWEPQRTQLIPLDVSAELKCTAPATSPALCANFIRILPGESLRTEENVTSELYYVLRGHGSTTLDVGDLLWQQGDFFCVPGGPALHRASEDAVLYYVHDAPLLRYLGVRAEEPRFRPTLYPRARCQKELERVRHHAKAEESSRISVLLANKVNDQTLTVTHVLWAMFGVLPRGLVQPAHRHQSVALDLAIDCHPGCYTLMGKDIDADGNIVDGERVAWESGAAFITPPGMWHSHHNESDSDAYVIPIQDAGLQTYLRSLDIRFGKLDA